MEKTINMVINDPEYYSPTAINDKAGKLYGYGRHHNKEVVFGITKTKVGEHIYCKTARALKFKPVMFCWLIGGHDDKGIQKLGVSFLYGGKGSEISLYLEELIQLLTDLGSEQEIKSWRDQLAEKNCKTPKMLQETM